MRPSSRRRALVDDGALALAQLGQGEGQPARPLLAVVRAGHDLLGARPLVGEEVLPRVLAGRRNRGVERLVAARQAHLHRLDLAHVDRKFLRDVRLARVVEARVAAVVDLGAKAAQVEEQGLLRGRGAGADHRPVAQDEVLHRRADPPCGVSGEAHVAFRLEACRRLHQADHALLHQIGQRQAVVLEAAGGADHQPHIGPDQLVQRALVLAVPPATRQVELMLARQERRIHRFADQPTVGLLRIGRDTQGHETCLRAPEVGDVPIDPNVSSTYPFHRTPYTTSSGRQDHDGTR